MSDCTEWYEDFDLEDLKQKTDGLVDNECSHEKVDTIDGADVCIECGVCIETLSFDKEWRYYGSSDTKNSTDPSRCHRRRRDQRTIYKVVEKLHIPEAIVESANEKYQYIIKDTVTDGIRHPTIYRGDRRLSVIAACLFHAYMEHGEPRTAAKIGRMFKLPEKKVNEGVDIYYEFYPEARVKYLTAHDLIRGIMVDVGINMAHFRKINCLCNYLQNKSSVLNRSTPQSVAAAIVYLHLCLMPEYKESLGLTKMRFSRLVGLSDITIGKLARDAAMVIKSEVKI